MKNVFLSAILALTMIACPVSAKDNTGYEIKFGEVNVDAINNGNLQFKGVTWCKKYFDKCIYKEVWNGPVLTDRQTVTHDQFVIMQTSITNPQIISTEDIGSGLYRITFVYDQNRNHEKWIPEYKKDK